MRFSEIRLIVLSGVFAAAFAACGGGSSGTGSSNSSCSNATQGASNVQTTSSTNVIPVYIADASTTGSVGYDNEPLVSVTVCSPNHTSSSQCQTISNILLDTGSYGLRVFSSVIANNVSLVQETVNVTGFGTLDVAECAEFGIGADWGPIQYADVQLGNQTATDIPIQVIDYNYASMPSFCADHQPDTDPCSAGYNGIIGVGLFAKDCGTDCNSNSTSTNPLIYLACNSSGCGNEYKSGGITYAIVPTAQVTNPISAFNSGSYNNGVSLTLPSVGSTGSSAVSGSMTIGISSIGSATAYPADASGETDGFGADFETDFISNGTTYGTSSSATSFLDSGSNGLFFPAVSGLSTCSDNSFFCGNESLQAKILGSGGSPTSGTINFSVVSADTLFDSGNSAFSTLAGQEGTGFDWGLPFFFGRTVYVGINGTVASLSSTQPFWAF